MQVEKTDVVVIGAGIIGLAVARALALAGREVMVLEVNPAIGQETSSRNSEVIHAGIYYPPGSLKAWSCVRGRELLYGYCESRGIPHRRVGKLIVARDAEQADRLGNLLENAQRNGVNDLEPLDRDDVRALEPEVRAEAGLLSPSTGIVDSHALMLALRADLETAGGLVATNSRVTGGYHENGGIQLQVVSGDETWLHAELVINAAGLAAGQVARSIPDVPDQAIPRAWFVKGQYFHYAGRSPFSRLVYPLPGEHGLGIHATLDQAGQLRFGPDARYVQRVDYQFDIGRLAHFTQAIRQWFPGLDDSRLQPGFVGVRPKLAGPDEKFSDFVISGPEDHGVPGLVSLFGIESPGLTACLALAEKVAEVAR
jgi:L-2-hydroxyglutarate oxidase LhgO